MLHKSTYKIIVIEIPLFHVVNARITFSNIQALDIPHQGVTNIKEESGRFSVAIDDAVFDIPRSYDMLGGASENTMRLYGETKIYLTSVLIQY